MSSEKMYVHFESCKARFETLCTQRYTCHGAIRMIHVKCTWECTLGVILDRLLRKHLRLPMNLRNTLYSTYQGLSSWQPPHSFIPCVH
jgi:hypothetical protein